MENSLKLFTIMPLDVLHIEEICEDIRFQVENGIATMPLFKMTLTPEGNPVIDKATILCKKYKLFKEKLDDFGIESGVLIQASIGHGWVLGERSPFQYYVGIQDGSEPAVCCPYDKGFLEYIKKSLKTIASYSPCHIMVDDDLRLMSGRQRGCACPLHMEKFNSILGTCLNREELWEIVSGDNEHTEEYTNVLVGLQKEALLGAAAAIREGIDSVDPKISGSYCCVGNNVECAEEISRILAGEGNPTIIRINNARYATEGNHKFSNAFYRCAQSVAKLSGKVDYILAETDTCPQNRYSTGAQAMHTHFVGSLLEGANGAKQWITRLSAYEPESGKAYRRVLMENRGLYDELKKLVPTLKWNGFSIPVTDEPHFDFKTEAFGKIEGWSTCVLERLGLPMYFSADGDFVCLEGDIDSYFNDEKILGMLKKTVFISSDSAKRLIDRGFGKYLGIDVCDNDGIPAIKERILVNGNLNDVQYKTKKLIPTSDDVIVHSEVLNTIDYENYTYLFPGVTEYKNDLGGTVFAFSGTPNAPFSLTTAFSFLSYSRKEQIISLFEKSGKNLCYYPDDEEVYFRTATMQNGDTLCAIFNVGMDPIENLKICTKDNVKAVSCILSDGSYRDVEFEKVDNIIKTDINSMPLMPVILILKRG